MSLTEIGRKHGTDKATHHDYTRLYERYFDLTPRPGMTVQSVGSLLELGIKSGASMAMWRDWLPGWLIVGLDNGAEGEPVIPDGTLGYIGDQSDPELLNDIGEANGAFDIIIDDASHVSSLSIASFTILWPHLKPGGWYVVEDTHSSYHDFYYGETEAHANPDFALRGINDKPVLTMMQFLKRLADEANFKGRHPEDNWDLFPREFWLGYDVEEVHFHFNICFVRKRA